MHLVKRTADLVDWKLRAQSTSILSNLKYFNIFRLQMAKGAFKIVKMLSLMQIYHLNFYLTWSYILRSSKNTVHLSHLSMSLASLIIVVIKRSKEDCSWNNDFARLRRSWFFLYSKTEASKSWAFCIPTPQKVKYFSKI